MSLHPLYFQVQNKISIFLILPVLTKDSNWQSCNSVKIVLFFLLSRLKSPKKKKKNKNKKKKLKDHKMKHTPEESQRKYQPKHYNKN